MGIGLNKRVVIVTVLFLIVGMLFATTVHVYGMNVKFNEVTDMVASVTRVKKEAEKTYYIHQVIDETSASMVEKVAIVAAAPEEDPVEDIAEESEEEFYEEDEYFEEEDSYESSAGDTDTEYDVYYSAGELRFMGVIYAGGWRWTWYSQNVLPGGGLSIPGRHVDENGFICDENDRICLASEDLEYGTVVKTPFGKEGCVYDCGCDYGTLDVYVDF